MRITVLPSSRSPELSDVAVIDSLPESTRQLAAGQVLIAVITDGDIESSSATRTSYVVLDNDTELAYFKESIPAQGNVTYLSVGEAGVAQLEPVNITHQQFKDAMAEVSHSAMSVASSVVEDSKDTHTPSQFRQGLSAVVSSMEGIFIGAGPAALYGMTASTGEDDTFSTEQKAIFGSLLAAGAGLMFFFKYAAIGSHHQDGPEADPNSPARINSSTGKVVLGFAAAFIEACDALAASLAVANLPVGLAFASLKFSKTVLSDMPLYWQGLMRNDNALMPLEEHAYVRQLYKSGAAKIARKIIQETFPAGLGGFHVYNMMKGVAQLRAAMPTVPGYALLALAVGLSYGVFQAGAALTNGFDMARPLNAMGERTVPYSVEHTSGTCTHGAALISHGLYGRRREMVKGWSKEQVGVLLWVMNTLGQGSLYGDALEKGLVTTILPKLGLIMGGETKTIMSAAAWGAGFIIGERVSAAKLKAGAVDELQKMLSQVEPALRNAYHQVNLPGGNDSFLSTRERSDLATNQLR